MTPEQKRKFNTTAGSIFIALGLIAWGMTMYYAFVPNPPMPTQAHNAPVVDINSCASTLNTWGYQTKIIDGEISIFEQLTTFPEQQLDKATMAIAVCKLDLKTFCMGEGCEEPGVSFTLQKPKTIRAQKTISSAIPDKK